MKRRRKAPDHAKQVIFLAFILGSLVLAWWMDFFSGPGNCHAFCNDSEGIPRPCHCDPISPVSRTLAALPGAQAQP